MKYSLIRRGRRECGPSVEPQLQRGGEGERGRRGEFGVANRPLSLSSALPLVNRLGGSLALPACLIALLLLGSAAGGAEPRPEGAYDLLFLADDGPLVLRLHIRIDGQFPQRYWQIRADRMFDRFDADGDGVLTGREGNIAAFSAMLRQFGLLPRTAPPFGSADAQPADGATTREEFRAYLENGGLKPFTVEFVAGGQTSGYDARTREAARLGIFRRLDRDNDEKLTPKELAAASKTLRPFDLDRDGSISAAELGPPWSLYMYQATPSNGAESGSDAKQRFALLAGRPSPQLARRVLDRYDGRKLSDGGANSRDRALSAAELGMTSETFADYDRDSSGKIDFVELTRLLRRPRPDLEVAIRLGRRDEGTIAAAWRSIKEGLVKAMLFSAGQPPKKIPAVELLRAGEPPRASVRTLENGVSLALDHCVLKIAFAGGASFTRDYQGTYRRRFKSADADKNGYLDAEESQRYGLGAIFEAADRDGDEKVFEKELLQAIEPLADARQSRSALIVFDRGQNFFGLLDRRADQRIGPREWADAARRFAAWDRNGDGAVEASELPRHYRLAPRHGSAVPTYNGSPVLNVRAASASRSGDAPGWFLKMDRNRDGDIARREFLGPPSVFTKLDADGDALLNAEEARRAEP